MASNVRFRIEGMDNLQRSLRRLGQVPQKHVTAASRKGMSIVLSRAKRKAPVSTGALKRGMKLAGEKSRKKGKKVYRIVFDRSMNDVFQKKNAAGQVVAYYPISQEYGYFTRNGKYIPGFRFIHGSFDENMPRAAQTIVDTMKQKVDQEIARARLR